MIEGRRAERQARERALVYRLGAANWVLNGRQSAKQHTTTNQKQAAAIEGTTEGRRNEREAWGSAISLYFGGGKSNEM